MRKRCHSRTPRPVKPPMLVKRGLINDELETRERQFVEAFAGAQNDAARWSAVEYLMLIGNVELNQDDDGGYSIGVEPVENFAGQVWKGDSPEEAVDKVAAQLEDAAMRAKEEKK